MRGWARGLYAAAGGLVLTCCGLTARADDLAVPEGRINLNTASESEVADFLAALQPSDDGPRRGPQAGPPRDRGPEGRGPEGRGPDGRPGDRRPEARRPEGRGDERRPGDRGPEERRPEGRGGDRRDDVRRPE